MKKRLILLSTTTTFVTLLHHENNSINRSDLVNSFVAYHYCITSWNCSLSPDEVTAEDEAEDEHEDARPEDDHVDVEGQVLEGDGRHCARLVGVNQSQTTEAPCAKDRGDVQKNNK